MTFWLLTALLVPVLAFTAGRVWTARVGRVAPAVTITVLTLCATPSALLPFLLAYSRNLIIVLPGLVCALLWTTKVYLLTGFKDGPMIGASAKFPAKP
jgi:hypothetical protein